MLRTTLIRLAILAVIAAIGGLAWWAQSYVRPEAVRAAVLVTFEEQLPEAKVSLGEAHMRVFGGISVRDLSFRKRDDTAPFFEAPVAQIYHDKEQISNGRLVIRKVELDHPTLRLQRHADGRWTFDGLAKPSPADRPVPTFVIKNGTILLSDRTAGGLPPLTLTDANFELVNDPPPLFLNVKGTAKVAVDGVLPPVPVELTGQLHRLSGQFTSRITVTDVKLGPEFAGLVKLWKPSLAAALATFRARATVKADVCYKPEAATQLTYDLDVKVKDGHWTDAALPLPADDIDAAIRFRDGKLTVEKATARFGGCTAEVSLESRVQSPLMVIPPPASGLVPGTLASSIRGAASNDADPLREFEASFERIDVTLKDLVINDDLFAKLGPAAEAQRARFQPTGSVSAGYHFSRTGVQSWKRELEVKPRQLAMTYDRFKYPLSDVLGVVRKTITSDGKDDTLVELTGTAGGQRVDIQGTITGHGVDPGINLRISGNGVPIDDRLFDALPKEQHRKALKKLRAIGRGDFIAEIKQAEGENLVNSTFRVTVTDGRFNYALFPYPLERVTGGVTITVATQDDARPKRPGLAMTPEPDTDTITLSDFKGWHGKGSITIRGTHAAMPRGPDRQLSLHVEGRECPIDTDMQASLAALKLDSVWRTFSPRGEITFAVDVNIADRVAAVPTPKPAPFDPLRPPGLLTNRAKKAEADEVPFNPATDLALMLNFTGPSITPDFFKYSLDRVAGQVRYDGARVTVAKFSAWHGESQWTLAAGEIRTGADGKVWSNLGQLNVAPLVFDDAFLTALPPTLGKPLKELNLRGGVEAHVRHLVVSTPPDASTPKIPQRLPGSVAITPVVASETVADADPDIYWSGELKLANAAFEAGVPWDRLQGRIASSGRYFGTHLGEVEGNVWLDEGRVQEQPVQQVKFHYRSDAQLPDAAGPGRYEPITVQFSDLNGRFYQGALAGEARLTLSEPVRYRLRLDALDVRLEEIARQHNLDKNGKLDGMAQASVRLETVIDPQTGQPTLDGAGSLDVEHGHLLNLPFLLPLLKTLKLQAPDKTAFEEGHAVFTVKGDRIRVTHLDLLGDAISLGGSGETDMKGQNVKFDFHTIWSQTLQRWLSTPFGDLNGLVSEQLFRIEVSRGTDGQLKYEARLVPFVTDPFRAIADRAKQRKQRLQQTRTP
jgi:hypothetical protein